MDEKEKLEDLCTYISECSSSNYGDYPICTDGQYKACPIWNQFYVKDVIFESGLYL